MSLLSRLAVQAARAYGVLSVVDKNRVSADYLVVAGGGGGGGGNGRAGGGGGAGGYLTSTATLSTLNTYSITVGAGGSANTQGANSVVSGTGLTTITSVGGGKGSIQGGGAGGNGGSGGGAGELQTAAGGTATSGQGNNGGAATGGYNSGGGGGAGAVGANASGAGGGAGGNGLASSISGSSVTYAGGGGGGSDSDGPSGNPPGGSGGSGGGGAGANSSGTGVAGTTNLGGGGGGGSGNGGGAGTGGAGGSGIVIISYTSATPKFVGGTITTSGGKQIHTFTSSGTLSPITPITASYLVVAGGGSGASNNAGGGGAGGLLTSSTTLYSGATYVVTVGAGGAGVAYNNVGNSGSNSVLSGTGLTTLTAIGGGNGGLGIGLPAGTGGSGGGGGFNAGGGAAGTSGQGNAGGNGSSDSATYTTGGGGGGAGGAGANATISSGGNGGVGISSSISGTATFYAGGGGGCGDSRGSKPGGTGGNGGGGNGGFNGSSTPGTINTGGGSGANGFSSGSSQNGGSGIVIISYAGSQQFNGGLVTTSGGNTIHTFTSTGALTPLTNNLNNSLRFRRSNNAYLSRTPTVAGNQKTWTYSAWVKRGLLGSIQDIWHANGPSTTENDYFAFDSDTLQFRIKNSNVVVCELITTQVFRDPSAWYHIVAVWDSTQATAANRVKLYVNGNQITAFSTATYPSQNTETSSYNNTVLHTIGTQWYNSTLSNYLDGYMTDINFIDGQALEPYYFGNNDANGVWKPILYKGTYGTNGFYLTFADTSALTTSSNAGLGKDTSGNGNYWTTNNISITSGSTYDPMLDVPTNTSATVANYCVLNPLDTGSNITLSAANLQTSQGAAAGISKGTIGISSGKWYWEVTLLSGTTAVGIADVSSSRTQNYVGQASTSYGYYSGNGNKYNNATGTSYGASYTTNDVIGVALDMDAGTLTFYKNNTSQGTAYSSLSGTFTPAIGNDQSNTTAFNAGQRPFAYTPPTGYVALNTYNLSTPTILQGNKYMDATLWTGDGTSSRSITNAALFKPDFVWIKNRSRDGADPYYGVHMLFNTVTGAGNRLMSQSTTSEIYSASSLTAFNSNGFSVGSDLPVNRSGDSFVGWQWQAGQGSTSSNTSGSITSTVSVNTTAGFSVVTYTGTGSTKTFGHGLGVTPAMFIVKSRSQTGENWVTWHKSFSNTAQGNMALNTTDAVSNSASVWGNTAPTSTLITVGNAAVNNNTSTYVCYAWAEIAGFSKFGSYTGNGSTDGPFVFTGFRPKYVMIKRTDSADDWIVMDSARNTYNVANSTLFPNGSYAETTDANRQEDFLSNGFKVRSSPVYINASGGTYIYAAFAENPFKNANAR